MPEWDEWDEKARELMGREPMDPALHYEWTSRIHDITSALRSAAERSAGERHPGTEPPEAMRDITFSRDVLACFGGRFAIAYYEHADGRWEEHSSKRQAPDFWQELPPLDRDGRRKGGGG